MRLGLMVSPEARDRLKQLAVEREVPQNRVVEDLIMREKHSGNGSSR